MDTVKKVLETRKSQTDQGEEQFLYTLAGRIKAGNTFFMTRFSTICLMMQLGCICFTFLLVLLKGNTSVPERRAVS